MKAKINSEYTWEFAWKETLFLDGLVGLEKKMGWEGKKLQTQKTDQLQYIEKFLATYSLSCILFPPSFLLLLPKYFSYVYIKLCPSLQTAFTKS